MDSSSSQTLREGRRAAFLGQVFSAVCFVSALLGAAFSDRLTSVLFLLSTFLFGLVCRYSNRYMRGDSGQSRFTLWLCVTGACVFALVLSQNLLLFALAWCGASLSLHQLLQFYQHRPAALLAARKKFLISRLGDSALIAALVLTHAQFGSWDFQTIFRAARLLAAAGPENLPAQVSWIAGLLVFAALLKSAQFPFHSWLPDTMETPTPVSALMHAGIINAGGILVIRLSPLVSLSRAALLILCIVGSFTALFASTVMLTQASVKRCLAFSTIAQMGFMMLECGLGAFHLALLHLVAHSLYKAHAFLSSGSVVLEKPIRQPSISSLTFVAGLASALAISLLVAAAFGVSPLDEPVLLGIFVLAQAQMFWTFWSTRPGVWQVLQGLATGITFSAAYFALGHVAELAVEPVKSNVSRAGLPILAAFILASVAQTQLPRLGRTSFGRRLYVHARNGFYFNTLANRITTALWPLQISQENI